uniref:RPA1 related single stranded DNA binding protein n=1 Tax=Tetraodon nigroviridis TaxID=99883 RepID=H3BYY9_TETNG
SFLKRTLKRLSSTRCVKISAEEAAPVAVVALQRYLSEDAAEQPSSYDVTVTDGVWRAKCLLHPALNHLVHSNSLRSGADVVITQCSYIYNERRLGHGYIRIEQLRCAPGPSVLLPQVQDDIGLLPVLVKAGMERSATLQGDVPLLVSRRHYLPLWNNDDPEGHIWILRAPGLTQCWTVSNIIFLGRLEGSFHPTWNCTPLLVKIIHKSKLRYYGRHGLGIDFPYQAYFEVADRSGTMSLVLWNELCSKFYQKLDVGTVIHLQNYSLKKSYPSRSRPQMDHHRMNNFHSVEISLNPRNPASVITVIPRKRVSPQWGLPEVAYRFISRSELEYLSNNATCDVIGLVTYVGRIERVRSKGTKGPEKYWTYRWVHMVDGTSAHPFILELFSSSQPGIFSHICPMIYLVCTQMRVCQVDGSPAYLTSSFETETLITGYHKGRPYVRDPKVTSFIEWTKTLKDNDVLEKTAIGGHYCYPHPPQKCLQTWADSSAQALLVAAADLKQEMETLQYREHKRLAIQGQITAVRYMTSLRTAELQTGEVTEKFESTFSRVVGCSIGLMQVPDAGRQGAGAQNPPLPAEQNAGASLAPQSLKTNPRRHIVCTSRLSASQKVGKVYPNGPPAVFLNVLSLAADFDGFSWESSNWEKQREEVTEHLRQGGLHQDSICRRFTIDDKNALLHWCNLQPSRWAPEHGTQAVPPADCPGYYQVTILGINKQIAVDAAYFPIVSTADPRAVGLHQDPHGNTMFSSLLSGFLCPLSDPASPSDTALPQPGRTARDEVLATASELEDTHVVCILDLCHLGGDKVEVVISKVYSDRVQI